MDSTVQDLTIRYFDRVLGMRFAERPLEISVSSRPQNISEIVAQPVCLLVEVGSGSASPSLREMGARLLEALRAEWIKHAPDLLPTFEWLQVDGSEWEELILEPRALTIVCGATGTRPPHPKVLHIASFQEMHSSPIVKREAWRAIQHGIRQSAAHQPLD